ncbi:cell division protein ZipA [uncultured Microbulbifer sp.]|uniref:cell division protein ZipA n=1 Tax=uncultured Microbulbifer sp. TaxID=348147 RepID=UPI002601ED8F|nr:cell division protein ZipA [uncultured Microbulbifer sp.]
MDNWLINLLALVLLGVVLDGARRAYLKHRDTVKVSRNLSRSMRRDLDDRNEDILSAPRPVDAPERSGATAAQKHPRTTPTPRKSANLTESELEYIDPEEAEKRRQISRELPGSVRVVQRRKPEDATQVNRQVQQNFQSSRKPLAGSKPEREQDGESTTVEAGQRPHVPEQVALNLEEQVPMLMDSVADALVEPGAVVETRMENTLESQVETSVEASVETWGEDATQSSADPMAGLSEEPVASDRREPSLDESVSLESLQTVSESSDEAPAESEERSAPARSGWSAPELKLPELKFPDLKKAVTPARESRSAKQAESRAGSAKKAGNRNTSSESRKERAVEEVLILNIMAPAGDCFEGNDLLRVLLSSGLRFGEMNIFHYHCGDAGEGPVLFSLANIVVPGTFDMSEMEDFTTPGISLFLALPAEVEAVKAFDTLLSTARNIAEQLGGELKDENRSVFTAQTAEHYRQRVMEFQRRKALARAQA